MAFARHVVAAPLVVVVLAAVGCGGGSPSAQEEWADDVCTSVGDWKSEMQSIADEVETAVKSPSADTVSTVTSAVDRGAQATQTLVNELQQIGAPPGDKGTEAKQIVQGVADNLRKTATSAKTQLEQLGDSANLSEAASTLGVVGTQLSAAVAQAESAYDQLVALGGDVKEGIEDADSCDDLRGD